MALRSLFASWFFPFINWQIRKFSPSFICPLCALSDFILTILLTNLNNYIMVTNIFLNGKFRNINPENPIKSMREVESFCSANGIKSIIKMQGGYYFINKNNQFEFIARSLALISLSEIYNLQTRKK